jgi:hypothetical protein
MNLELYGEEHNCEELSTNTLSKIQGPSPRFWNQNKNEIKKVGNRLLLI